MVNQERVQLLKRIADSETLPSLSPLAIQLIELASDDRSSASDLASIIEKDPGLTTRLLKLVGSAFFSRQETVASISQAVVLVGFKKLRIMALSLSLRDTFPMDKGKGLDFQLFWKTSLYQALIAQDLAKSAQGIDDLQPDEAFVGGLISEIGMLLLFSECPEEKKEDFPGREVPLEKAIAWEEENLGINHRDVGNVVLKRWRFPDPLVESQKYFGPDAFEAGTPVLCKTLELARRATDTVFGQTADFHELHQLVRDLLELDAESVNGILADAFGKVEELAKQLLIEVDSQTDILAVMEKANQTLARINSSMQTTLQGLVNHVNQHDQSLNEMSEKMAESGQDILQNTLDAVAHEIRNPLLAIGGFSKRLAREAKEEDRGSQYAEIISKESSRLEEILNEIMEFCKDYVPAFAEENVISLAEEVLAELGDLLREKQIRVVRDFFGESVEVPLDKEGLVKVLRQLLENAIHMIGEATGTVTVSVQPVGDTGQVSIRISDDGRAVPREVRDALIDGNLSAKTFGGGLGLPLARRIIEAHKGRVELVAEEDRGNTATVYLPTA
jgi:HD-like signal output (HDOD) protein